METFLRSLRVQHDIKSVSISLMTRPDGRDLFVVYLHPTTDTCTQGLGDTMAEAIAEARDELSERRAAADNAAEAAYLDRQQSLMESGCHDDSAYRRDIIQAGRGHLVGGR